MFRNYFILNRFVLEANSSLIGNRIISAFTQEKEKLLFELSNGIQSKFIEISTASHFEYITLRDNYSRAKRNTIDFFPNHIPAAIVSFEISDSDRIIKIHLDNSAIYFFLRGKYSNVILIDKFNQAEFFKKQTDLFITEIVNEINNTNFISHKNIPSLNFEYQNDYFTEAKNRFPFLGKGIINEAKKRDSLVKGLTTSIILEQVIEEALENQLVVCFNDSNNNSNFPTSNAELSIDSFNHDFTRGVEFSSVVTALNYFLQFKFTRDDYLDIQKTISKYLSKELERTAERLNNARSILTSESKEDEYNRTGNLLLINISGIKKGMELIELEDVYKDNLLLKIKLIKTFSPKQNVDYYFEKAKNERIKFERAKENIIFFTENFSRLKMIEERFNKSQTIEELKVLMKELKLSSKESSDSRDDIKNKFKHFLIDGKYNAFVGKDSASNDLLTVKFAKQNDYWFHARSVSGSHVVLRVESSKEGMPKNILKKAASLAAFYSKSKTSGTAPVSYTLKKYVIKKKGMEPGKVALLKEEVLLVKPEIPSGCELLNND
ncbi:MAG: NFACT RNA binding domain-containing protein [Ignavibacteriaceae bacterium]